MSGRSTRSNTWRFSICVADLGSSDEPQWPHAHASCRTVRSGSATCSNVPPSWPVWPPLALPERPRRLPGMRGFFFNPSLEGGLELFELSCPNWRRRSATSASSAAIRLNRPSFPELITLQPLARRLESALPNDRICVRKRNVFQPHCPIVHRGERDEDRALGFVAA